MSSQKRLSCKRCQTRKVRCNRLQPCSNCSQIGTTCEYRHVDARRRPVSQTHLAALDSRLAWYDSVFRTLKNSSSSDRDALLNQISFDDHTGELPTTLDVSQMSDDIAHPEDHLGQTVALLPGPSGTLQYHGPTSMYLNEGSHGTPPPAHQPPGPIQESLSCMRLAMTLGIDDGLIQTCLRLFFVQEYCHCMFIYREAFLEDYYTNGHDGKYWSYPLLYAICALGAMRSDDLDIRSKAPLMAKCAQEAIFTHCLSSPNINTVQALLCVAFHELGQGSSSLGWLFSGMAFRIAQELGFHQDPRIWINSDSNITNTIDIEIRRRVYWGCFVADKYISLFLGRPVHLAENDAAVVMSEPLPDFPDDHNWFGLGAIASDEAYDLQSEKPRLTLALKYAVSLGEIFQDAMTNVFSPKSARKSEAAILSVLGQLNIRLNRWLADLPEQLQWSQWVKKGQELRRSVLELHLFYHSVVLSLNRHFLLPGHHFRVHQASSEACAASCGQVLAMLRHFRNNYGSLNTSLMMIYAVVLIAIILVADSPKPSSSMRGDPRVIFCMRILHESSDRYKLAGEAHARLVVQLNLSTCNQESSTAYHDGTTFTQQELPPYASKDISQGADSAFGTFFEPEHDGRLPAPTFSVGFDDAVGSSAAAAVAEFAPEAGSMGQSNLDMFSVLMQDDPIASLHGDFYGWFSGVFV